jgi:hypothetical protein
MNDTHLDALIDAGTAALGITIQPEWRDAIRMHLAISLGHMQTVLEEPLADHIDPAPVFRP